MASIPIKTPCGTINVPLPPFPGFPPTISLNIFPLPFPPTFQIPMPDCSILKHLGSDKSPAPPDPPEDSQP